MSRTAVRAWVVVSIMGVCARVVADDAAPRSGEPAQDRATSSFLQLSAEQHLGVGFDSNPTLSPAPELRRDQGGPEVGPSPLLATETSLGALYGNAWWTGAQLALDGRLYLAPSEGAGTEGRFLSALRGFGGWDGGPLALMLVIDGGRYDASFAADNAWSGRALARGELSLGGPWRFGVQTFAGLRRYDADGLLDRNGGGGVDLGWRNPRARLTLGLEVDRRESDEPTVVRSEIVPSLRGRLRAGDFEGDARYFLLARVFDAPDHDGVEHVAQIEAAYWLSRWVAPFVRFEGGIARGQAAALDYERWAVLGGLRARWDAPSTRPPDRRAALRVQGGATLEDDAVQFRFRVPGARRVSILASFNGWDADAGRLEPRGDGVFEGRFEVPRGRHRYQLLVDGVPTRAPHASAYTPDDFGGEDAVLIVP